MTLATNYTNLKTLIGDYLDRADTDEDHLINMAEARMERDIRIRDMISRSFFLSSNSATISGATQADPVVTTTSAAHGFSTGDRVYIEDVTGMTEINDKFFIITVLTTTTFELDDEDGTGHTAYTSGGTATLAAVANRQEPLPGDFLEVISFRVLTDPVTVLEEVNYHEMNRIRTESNGKPTRYVIGNEFEFDVKPDDSYKAEIIYYKSLTPLSSSNTTNAILTRAPDAYLYAALVAAEPFLFNDERLSVWEKLYTSARDRLNGMDRDRSSPLISRVVGDTP